MSRSAAAAFAAEATNDAGEAVSAPPTAGLSGPAVFASFEALGQGAIEKLQGTWRTNLTAGAETVRTFQQQNTEFASQLAALNVEAVRVLSSADPIAERMSKQMKLGASALELYLGYLGRSAALVQNSFTAPFASRGADA